MERHFYVLKAGMLVVAIAIAGWSTNGFDMGKLSSRVDSVHYSAAAYATCAFQGARQNLAHALGDVLNQIRGR